MRHEIARGEELRPLYQLAQHINFYGRYEFTKGLEPINVEAIVEALAQQPLMPGEDEA